MNDLAQNIPAHAPAPRTFHHHPLALWRPLAFTISLTMFGFVGILIWAPFGLGFWLLALVGAGAVYAYWRWNTFTFINGNRLVRRHGFLGCAENIITLFGVISPYQTPIVGRLLNVGSVHLGIPGPDIHIHHIAHFRDFYTLLVYGAEQQQRQLEQPLILVFSQMPPQPYYWPNRPQELHAGQPEHVHFHADEVRQ